MTDYFDDKPQPRKRVNFKDPAKFLRRIIKEVYNGDLTAAKGRALCEMLRGLKTLEEHTELKREIELLKEKINGQVST